MPAQRAPWRTAMHNMALTAGHNMRRLGGVGWRCTLCLQGPGQFSLEDWLRAHPKCQGVSYNKRVAEGAPARVQGGVRVGAKTAHSSHALSVIHGCIFCTSCGATGVQTVQGGRIPAKLQKLCTGTKTVGAAYALDRIRRGIPPRAGKDAWPDGTKGREPRSRRSKVHSETR